MATAKGEARLDLADAAFEDGMLDRSRAWVHAQMAATVPDRVRDDVVLVADTLVARGFWNLSRPAELRLRPVARGRCVRIEVQLEPIGEIVRPLGFPDAIGPDLIYAFGESFGLEDRDDGPVMWAEVAL